jgi:hypothetical protein
LTRIIPQTGGASEHIQSCRFIIDDGDSDWRMSLKKLHGSLRAAAPTPSGVEDARREPLLPRSLSMRREDFNEV